MEDSDLTEAAYTTEFETQSVNFQPWLNLNEKQKAEQEIIKTVLQRKAGARFGKNSYVARNARIFTQYLLIGDRSLVAAGAILRGNITIGSDCSINSYSHVAGKVNIGSGVRIAGHVAIYGFNHGTRRTDMMIKDQPITMLGVSIGDGCWLGTHCVILDNITIGQHCIIAAGAIVTKSFPDYQIIAGNPARSLGDRRDMNTTEVAALPS